MLSFDGYPNARYIPSVSGNKHIGDLYNGLACELKGVEQLSGGYNGSTSGGEASGGVRETGLSTRDIDKPRRKSLRCEEKLVARANEKCRHCIQAVSK